MKGNHRRTALLPAALLAGIAVTFLPASSRAAGDLDEARLKAADSEPQNWFTLGRDQNQTYFSPLAKIDATNVSRLGFAWDYDLAKPSIVTAVAIKRRPRRPCLLAA